MPSIRQVIIAAWARLPAEVREYEPFRNAKRPGEPSSSAIKTILLGLLREVRPYEDPTTGTTDQKKKFAQGHWGALDDESSSPAVTADGAARVSDRLSESHDLLVDAVSWHRALATRFKERRRAGERLRGDGRESLMLPSLALASPHGPFVASQHAALLDGALADVGSAVGGTWNAIRSHLDAHAEELQAALDDLWASRPARGKREVDPGLAATRAAFLEVAFAAAGPGSVPKWGRPGWGVEDRLAQAEALLADVTDHADDGRTPDVYGLSRLTPPSVPRLRGIQTGRKSVPALDRPIELRLYAALRVPTSPGDGASGLSKDAQAARALAGTSAEDLIGRALAASAAPLGLQGPQARALVLLMDRLIEHLAWVPKHARQLEEARVAPGFDAYYFGEWQKLGDSYLAKAPKARVNPNAVPHEGQPGLNLTSSATLLGDPMNEVLENPRWLFVGAIWRRAFRLDLANSRVDASSAWNYLTRAIHSVFKEAKALATARAKRGEAIFFDEDAEVLGEPAEAQARPAVHRPNAARDEVLRRATRVHGGAALVDFLAGLRTESHAANETWEGWVREHATYLGNDSLDEYPTFDQVRAHLTPALSVTVHGVEAVGDYARTHDEDPEAWREVLRRMVDGKASTEDRATWDRWRAECAAETADNPVPDLVAAIESLPTFDVARDRLGLIEHPGSE